MIIFYHGADSYRLRSAVTDTIAQSRARQTETVVHTFEADTDEGLESFERALKYSSLIPQQTVIVFRNVLANAQTAQAVLDLLEAYDLATTTDYTVIVCQEGIAGRESAATKSLTSYLTTHARTSVAFVPLTGSERSAWITAFCAQRGTTIQPAAANAVAHRTGGDSWALATELEKLCAYAGTEPIGLAMVDTLISVPYEQDEWRLTNALSAGNKRLALATLWERVATGTSVPLLVGLLAHATRTLLTRSGSPYSSDVLIRTHRALAELDRSSKSGLTDGEDRLFTTLLNL